MTNYKVTVFIDNGDEVVLSVMYERDYELRRDITSLGTNGVLNKTDYGYFYYPPHKINSIKVEEINK